MVTTDPRPDGTHTHRTDRGYESITRYFDDGSQVMVAHQEYAGSAIEWRPKARRDTEPDRCPECRSGRTWDSDMMATSGAERFAWCPTCNVASNESELPPPRRRTSRTRGIWWEENDATLAWINRQAPAMPDHIWQILVEELPWLDLTPRSSP